MSYSECFSGLKWLRKRIWEQYSGRSKNKNCILCKLANLIQILVVFRLHAEGSNPWDSSAYEQKLTSLQPVSNQVFVLLVGGGVGGGGQGCKWVGRQFQIIMKRSRPVISVTTVGVSHLQ